MRGSKIVSVMVAGVASCTLAFGVLPTATAAEPEAVASARSFPKANVPRRSILAESTATSVEDDSDWGGVADVNVPHTKSQAEKDAEAAAQAAAQAEAEAAQRAEQQRAASRSAAREPLTGRADAASGASGAASGAPASGAAADAPASASGAAIVTYAMQFQGVPYVYGGTSPAGFDCSGFTQYVFGHFGISLGRTDAAQRGAGTRVSTPAPGDLMWKPGHVGIYVGNGMMVHATKPGDVVRVASASYYSGWEYYRLV